MNKLDIKEIKRLGDHVFKTKKEMLNYINKMSFEGYKAVIWRYGNKWLVSWERV